MTHQPVLLTETIEALVSKKNGIYLDVTFGVGGHTKFLLKQLSAGATVIATDRDSDAIDRADALREADERFSCYQERFSDVAALLKELDMYGKIDGVMADFGVSSPQLDQAERGFSFRYDAPLDMRMDAISGQPASEWLRSVDRQALITVLRGFGEERYARRIADAILERRETKPIETTLELAKLVEDVKPRERLAKRHPATKTFQAIRMFVNDELAEIKKLLADSLTFLAPQGRICIISFHSLEDRLVKRFFRDQARGDLRYRGLPSRPKEAEPKLKLLGKAIKPSEAEIKSNPRARSAVLRVAERCA